MISLFISWALAGNSIVISAQGKNQNYVDYYFSQANIEHLITTYEEALAFPTFEAWNQVLDLFWRHEWPIRTHKIFARAQRELIVLAPGLSERRREIQKLGAKSELFKSLSRQVLTPSEREKIDQHPTARLNIRSDEDQYFLNGIRLEGRIHTIPRGTHRLAMISNRHLPVIEILQINQDTHWTPPQIPFVSGNCLSPSFHSELTLLQYPVRVHFGDHCTFTRRRGTWVHEKGFFEISPPSSPKRPRKPWIWTGLAFLIGLSLR